MKRPIAEFLTITIKAGAESERTQYEHEAWQILRRKQGYVTHRIYQQLSDPLQRLVYSEWESAKAVEGARQYLQGTPLMRRARRVLSGAPNRQLVELVGPITSTKGIDLPENAVAAGALIGLTDTTDEWRVLEEQLWKVLSVEPGYLSHILLRGFDNPSLVGSFSHWSNGAALEQAFTEASRTLVSGTTPTHAELSAYTLYRPLRD